MGKYSLKMGNACSTGSSDRKGSDAYNPSSQINADAGPAKSNKPSWKKNSKSKEKNGKFSDALSPKVEEQQLSCDVRPTEPVKVVEHSKLESKISEDISTASLPIVQIEVPSKSANDGDSFLWQYDEDVRNLLIQQKWPKKATQRAKKIVLYICADYNDFSLEHSLVREKVYPDLREYCADQKFELCLIDLHNKLKSEYLDDHSFVESCIEEIKNRDQQSHVIPLILLKSRYGFSMIPNQISKNHFENLLNSISEESEKSLLSTWYYLEKNVQTPNYLLRNITTCLPNFTSSKPEERNEAALLFENTISKIREILWKNLASKELKEYYFKTESEIKEAAFQDPVISKNCLIFSKCTAEKSDLLLPIEQEATDRIQSLYEDLKAKLEASKILKPSAQSPGDTNIYDAVQKTEYNEDFVRQVSSGIKCIIDNILNENISMMKQYKDLNNSLLSELTVQSIMCAKHAQNFKNSKEALQRLKMYIEGDENEPLIVYGPPGCGKTSLLSMAAQMCDESLPNATVVFRIVGISLESSTEENISKSICQQCYSLCQSDKQITSPMNFADRAAMLPNLFAKVSSVRPCLVVIIDGIDQIPEFSSTSFSWLPSELSNGVKVILSLSENSPYLNNIKEIIQNQDRYFSVPKTPVDDAFNVFQEKLSSYDRCLVKEQQEFLKEALKECSIPLYTDMLVQAAKSWSSEYDIDDISIGDNVESQIAVDFNTAERKFGKIRVSYALGFLTAGKYGLADSEIQDLLNINESKICEETKDFDNVNDVLPVLFWIQLKRNLSHLFSNFDFHGVPLTRWRSREVFAIAKSRYLKDSEQNAHYIRTMLMNYFQNTCKMKETSSEDHIVVKNGSHCLKERAYCELPYQSFYVEECINDTYLFDKDWLEEKLSMCDAYQLLEDIVLCLTESQSHSDLQSDLLLMKEFIELSHDALSWNGSQLLSQIYGRLNKFFESDDSENSKNHMRMKKLFDLAKAPSSFPILLPLRHAIKDVYSPSNLLLDEEDLNYSAFFKISNYPQHMISISPCKGMILVWDILLQKAVRTLKGITNPRDVQMIDEYHAVVLCNRELKVYNLDDGVLIRSIKGVMNQSMPYFGLHNHEHVVALSRNRMYVNMMNTQTGDLVTTFKVGEDRFLNSLIVSKNGKVCVCGDQTQKPSPLLVWDLTSRKLMYDLRIPHHEFLTKLAAITDDGNYVVCVSKEVDNSTPSNVVVYDLQSGTLFKKWKPDSNTCSIEISSNGNCVITALEDNTIVIWDLITGALRATLKGYTAPVTHILLSEQGTHFVTYDSTNTDKTVRLWDSTTSSAIASFTPDFPVICCQISAQGDSIVLGLDGGENIATLVLCDKDRKLEEIQISDSGAIYGNESNNEKVFDLS
ncbi:NACHT and WD repeat domain-containing protein 2 [Nymphon striatum]|nr:NACHT and WD repeat domain-containing protein 2 [Nymphon striatum]